MSGVPEVETERLLMRGWRDSDIDAWAELSADDEVMRSLGREGGLSLGDSWREMAFLAGHWTLKGFGHWALELRDPIRAACGSAPHADPRALGRAERLRLGTSRALAAGHEPSACGQAGELVGRAGLFHPPDWPGLEIGWTVARPHWGNGYAGEAARATMEWARAELGADHLISLIADDNRRSQRVAEKLGMEQEGRAQVRGHDLRVYGIDLA